MPDPTSFHYHTCLRPGQARTERPTFKKTGSKCHSSRHVHRPKRRQLEVEIFKLTSIGAHLALGGEVICLGNDSVVVHESPVNMASFCLHIMHPVISTA